MGFRNTLNTVFTDFLAKSASSMGSDSSFLLKRNLINDRMLSTILWKEIPTVGGSSYSRHFWEEFLLWEGVPTPDTFGREFPL